MSVYNGPSSESFDELKRKVDDLSKWNEPFGELCELLCDLSNL